MKRSLFLVVVASLIIAACGVPEQTSVEPQIAETAIKETSSPVPTAPLPPTRTPEPTTSAPIILTGSGDSVIDFEKWDGPGLIRIKYIGDGNFSIRNYPANSADYYDLLVNIIGSYEGIRPLDFFDGENTARLEITASGQWEIQILPFAYITSVFLPSTYQGTGDDVIAFPGNSPDLLKIDASQATSNFVILSFTPDGRNLIVNEIAPYTGTTILDPETMVLVIEAKGPWSLEITTK